MLTRETVLLSVALLVVAAGALVYWQTRPEPEPSFAPPFFYQLEPEAINSIAISHAGATEAFVWSAETNEWVFQSDGAAVDPERWGGMAFLLSGPRIERTLPPTSDLARYGLRPAQSTVEIGLDEGDTLVVLIGNRTPNGADVYVMQQGADGLLLVDGSWADVIEGMVTDPPRLESPTNAPS